MSCEICGAPEEWSCEGCKKVKQMTEGLPVLSNTVSEEPIDLLVMLRRFKREHPALSTGEAPAMMTEPTEPSPREGGSASTAAPRETDSIE